MNILFAFNIGQEYPFGEIQSLGHGTSALVLPAFGLAATVVVIYFIIGAVKYLVSGGDKTSVSDAQGMITHALIGFLLLMVLFLIMQFIPQFFGFDFKIISR